MAEKIKRKFWRSYIDAKLEKGATASNFYRLGEDNDDLSRSLNWNTEETNNVWGETRVTATRGGDTMDVAPFYAKVGDPMYLLLRAIDTEHRELDDIKRDYIECWADNEEEVESGELSAFKQTANIMPQSVGGPATDGVDYPFNIALSGEKILGTFDLKTKTFKPEM